MDTVKFSASNPFQQSQYCEVAGSVHVEKTPDAKRKDTDCLEKSYDAKRLKKNKNPQRLLAQAIRSKDPEKLYESIRSGANINAYLNKPQMYPIFSVLNTDSSSPFFDHFMGLKPRLDVIDKTGLKDTPLSRAVFNEDVKAVKCFLMANAPLDTDVRKGGWLYDGLRHSIDGMGEVRSQKRKEIAEMLALALSKSTTFSAP